MYSNRAVLEENRLSDNSVGAFLMNSRGLIFTGNEISGSDGPSGYGLGLKDMDEVEATANQFSGNRVGIFIDNSPTTTRLPQLFTDNLFAFNDIGLAFLPAVKGNIFTGNAFVDNRRHVAVLGTGSFDGNTWTVDGLGNYWSDFAGYDADGDGVGDIAFRIDDLFATLTDRQPMLTFLAETPSAKLLDAAADAFPILRPSAIVVDEAPMMNMPMTLASEVEGNRTLFGLVAVLMLGIAAVILRAGFRGTVS
jgi:nitrous oxidase accessory protein